MKKWIYIFLALICGILLLPLLVSTPPLKMYLLKKIGDRFDSTISASKVHLSWTGPQIISGVVISSPNFDGKIEQFQSPVPFWSLNSMGSEFSLQGAQFHTQQPEASLTNVSANITPKQIQATGAAQIENKQGSFLLNGNQTEEGMDLAFSAKQIPTLFFDHLFHAKGMIQASLGDFFDCNATANIFNESGTYTFSVLAQRGHIQASGAFTAENITLTEPLIATLQLTPELSAALLKDANPLFLTGISSKEPIKLIISNKRFLLERPFTLEKLRIGQGVLELGQTKIQNGPSLIALVKLLKNQRVANLKEMNAWFTPLEFSIESSIFKSGRMDFLLADSIHLCTWGHINLANDHLDMMIGIPANVLSSVFHIQNLPSNFMLKIPVKGTTNAPEIETGAASAKIAALLASQTIPKKAGPLGKAFTILTPPVTDDSRDVPPAKRPFPWEK